MGRTNNPDLLCLCVSGLAMQTKYDDINGPGGPFMPRPVSYVVTVPQGSVLGPLLFLLYIDDLHNVVSNSTLKLFADDVALYREVKCSADCSLIAAAGPRQHFLLDY